MTRSSINLSLASQTERLNSLCNGLAYLSVPGRPHTLVLGVSAWIVLGRCPSGQVPSIVATSTRARREHGLLMTHVLNREGTTDPNQGEVNLSCAFMPSFAPVVRQCSGGERSLSRCVQIWLVCGWAQLS